MDDLIEALTIFRKYKNERWPTICVNDELTIAHIGADDVDEGDVERLYELGFFIDRETGCFRSTKFGNC